MRVATRSGRAVPVSSDGATTLDVATASDGAFGPDPRAVHDRWPAFADWVASTVVADAGGDPIALEELGPPSPDPRQVFAIGMNYRGHAEGAGLEHAVGPFDADEGSPRSRGARPHPVLRGTGAVLGRG